MRRSLSVVGFAAIAVAIALAVTTGCKKPEPATGGTPAPPAVSGPSGGAGDVEQATCPVMGRTMAKADMVPVTYEGETYYLCCTGCKPKFDADPEKYVGAEGQPEEGSAMEHEHGDEEGAHEDADEEGEHEHGDEEGEHEDGGEEGESGDPVHAAKQFQAAQRPGRAPRGQAAPRDPAGVVVKPE